MAENGKIMLFGILMSVLKYGFCETSPTPSVCEYEFRGLDSSITVNSSLEIGDTVYTLVVDIIATTTTTATTTSTTTTAATTTSTTTEAIIEEVARKKRETDTSLEVSEYDITLLNEASYFGLRFSAADNYHELTVTSCLGAGQTQTLEFMFNGTFDEEAACDIARLTIEIEATTPEFDIDTAENLIVDVGSCTLVERLKVSPVMFANDVSCLIWSCGVKCLNDEKIFWIDASTPDIAIYTSSEDIDYNKTYDLLLTCFDTPVPFLSTNQIVLQAKFNQSITCTSQGTAAANQLQETTPEGYFDEPANVALVASVSALTAGSALGAGLYILAAKRCKRKNQTTDETENN